MTVTAPPELSAAGYGGRQDHSGRQLKTAERKREVMIAGLLNPDGDINLHTHTNFCDGKNPPEEMAEAAESKRFRVLGFSGHGYAPYDTDCCMTQEGEREYRARVLTLKEAYRGRLDIRLGIERDCFASEETAARGETPDPFEYDYEIGSVHYVRVGNEYFSVDTSADETDRIIREVFGGSARAYAEEYFRTEGEVLSRTHADIVGHFDLVRIFNDDGRFFDETADWYRDAALSALRQICAAKASPRRGIRDVLGTGPLPVFEINTGGVAKGRTKRPYPAPFILEELQRIGCPLILSSDCHDAALLDFGFRELAK